jgi:hypothetical protein
LTQVLLYVWALARYPALQRLNNPDHKIFLMLLGLWEVDIARDCVPMFGLVLLAALCFYSFRALVRTEALGGWGQGEATTLANALGAEAARRGAGYGQLWEPGLMRRIVGVVVDGGGAYLVLASVFLLVVLAGRVTFITLVYFGLMVMCLTVPLPHNPKRERSAPRWRLLANYAVATFFLIYIFGTFDLAITVLRLSPASLRFLREDVGMTLKESPRQLMADLLQPSMVLLLLQVYRYGLGSRYWVKSASGAAARIMATGGPAAGASNEEYLQLWQEWEALRAHCTYRGFFRRAAVLHANKLVIAAALYAALHSPDLVGLVFMAAVVPLSFGTKTKYRWTKFCSLLAAAAMCIQFAFQIPIVQRWQRQQSAGWFMSHFELRVAAPGPAGLALLVHGKVK